MIFSTLFLSLLLKYTFSAHFNVEWDGENSPIDLHIVTGDDVTWSSSIPPPFMLTSAEFSPSFMNGTFSFTFNMQGEYPYVVSSSNSSNEGVVKVKDAIFFDKMNYHYDLKVGDVIRWQWVGPQPDLPYSFGGFCPEPGYPLNGMEHYDYYFMVPGKYSWWHNMSEYHFCVEDPDAGNHLNLDWNSYASYHVDIEEGVLLRFYNTDNRKHNVRILGQDNMGMPDWSMVLWISPDIYAKGESIANTFPPGHYFAMSDYDPNITVTINIMPRPQDHKDKGHGMIPKAAVHALEISLFMLGVIGLGNFIFDKVGSSKNDKHEDPVPGGDMSTYALDRSKERISTTSE